MNAFKIVLGMLVVTAMWSCYPGSVTTSEVDTVITVYDDEHDFSTHTTFFIRDTIDQIGEGEELDDKFDQDIINRTAENMRNIGYQQVNKVDSADIVLLLSKTSSNLVIVVPPPCYWCGWPGYPGYPPYYPWYPPGYVYTYPVGTLFCDMLDPSESGDETAARWTYRVNGLISGSDSFIRDRLNRTIDQAFTQSPYLGK